MSLAALLEAVRDRLRVELNLKDTVCDVEIRGDPPPFAGSVYFAVHPASKRSIIEDVFDENYEVGVTVTQRIIGVPIDRWGGEFLLRNFNSIDRRTREVAVQIHNQVDVLTRANNIITTDDPTQNGIIEPLRWTGTESPPRVVDGTWFTAQPETDVGLVVEVQFGGARRLEANLGEC